MTDKKSTNETVKKIPSLSKLLMKEVREKLNEERAKMAWLKLFAGPIDRLQSCGIVMTHSSIGLFAHFDFDNLTHEQVVQVIVALPAKWKKEPNSQDASRVDYAADFGGVLVRCWSGGAPPNCKVVEVEEVVPAQPEQRKMVKRLVCAESTQANQEMSR